MKSIYIVIACVSFLFGVFSAAIFGVGLILAGSFVFWGIVVSIKNKKLAVFLVFVALGIFRYWVGLPNINEKSIHYYRNENENVKVRGVISSDPDRRR